ncbi:MAG: hypothetical protein ABIN48_00830 [Ginsengibacter sp.]
MADCFFGSEPDKVMKFRTLARLELELFYFLSTNLYGLRLQKISDIIKSSSFPTDISNQNFELLTPKPIRRFSDLAKKNLLADYTISYHYSLFLLQQKDINKQHQNSFIAFAPGFTDGLKNSYLSVSKDSFKIDNNYLSLLPQPFSIDLAEKSKSLLGGKSITYGQSTKQFFRENAGGHQVIHIGTHAESNNDYPEYSRLIFAKNI